MNFFIFIFIFLLAHSDPVPDFGLQGGLDSRYLRTTDQTDGFRRFWTLGIKGRIFERWWTSGEYSTHQRRTQTGSLGKLEKHDEIMVWMTREIEPLSLFHPFWGGGLGLYQIGVETQLGPSLLANQGSHQLTWGLELGADVHLTDLIQKKNPVYLTTRVRMLNAADYQPQPFWSLVVLLGVFL